MKYLMVQYRVPRPHSRVILTYLVRIFTLRFRDMRPMILMQTDLLSPFNKELLKHLKNFQLNIMSVSLQQMMSIL